MCCEFVESCWEELETLGALDNAGRRPTFSAAKTLLAACLVAAQHLGAIRHACPRPANTATAAFCFDRQIFVRGTLRTSSSVGHLLRGLFADRRDVAMLQMQYSHIALFAEGAVVALPLTKMGRRRGAAEMVTVECPVAIRLFIKARDHCHLDEKLVISPELFRRWWRDAILSVELDPDIWRPYGLRHGGATE